MLSIMNKELERLAFLKGFRIGLITAKSNLDINNYINKLDYEINNLEHKDIKEEYSDKTEIKQNNNTTNLYTLLHHINNKINTYIKKKNNNSNNIMLLNKTKFSHRTIQYIQAQNIKLNNEIENLKKIYDILYNKYMKLLSNPINEESNGDKSILQNSILQNSTSPNLVTSNREEKVRNFIYNPTAFDNISASLNNTLSELTDTNSNSTNTNANTNANSDSESDSESNSQNPIQNESVVQQFNQSINNLTSLIMDDS